MAPSTLRPLDLPKLAVDFHLFSGNKLLWADWDWRALDIPFECHRRGDEIVDVNQCRSMGMGPALAEKIDLLFKHRLTGGNPCELIAHR